MDLQVENYYQEQGQLFNWSCKQIFETPVYNYEVDLDIDDINDFSNNGWLIHSIIPQPANKFDVLLQRKPTLNCDWILTGDPEDPVLSTYTLLATPQIDTEPQHAWSFLINKTWTYGDITTNILLILVLGVFVWDMLRRMFKTRF